MRYIAQGPLAVTVAKQIETIKKPFYSNREVKDLLFELALAINHLPSENNVAEIVRCKDCQHFDDGICMLDGMGVGDSETFYCGAAEKEGAKL